MKARSRRKKRKFPRIIVMIPALALLFYLSNLPLWDIQEIRVNGARLLSADEIKKISGVQTGKNLFYFSFAGPRANLKKISAIEEFHLYRLPPGTVLINLKERKPIAVIVAKNSSAIVDNKGFILNHNPNLTLNIPNMTQLPVISGVGPEEFSSKEQISPKVSHLINAISTQLGSKQIKLEMGGMEKISFLLDDILKVKLGRNEAIDQKMAVFKKLLPVVQGKWAGIEYIDVRYPDNPVVKYK
ncbi:MAG: FtsQ-type POTRA domain-containing protein [bacterium]